MEPCIISSLVDMHVVAKLNTCVKCVNILLMVTFDFNYLFDQVFTFVVQAEMILTVSAI